MNVGFDLGTGTSANARQWYGHFREPIQLIDNGLIALPRRRHWVVDELDRSWSLLDRLHMLDLFFKVLIIFDETVDFCGLSLVLGFEVFDLSKVVDWDAVVTKRNLIINSPINSLLAVNPLRYRYRIDQIHDLPIQWLYELSVMVSFGRNLLNLGQMGFFPLLDLLF